MGTPVVFLDPRSKGAESYKAFAWEFMAKNPTRGFAAPSAVVTPAVETAPVPAVETAPVNDENQCDSSAPAGGDDSVPGGQIA